VNPELETRNSKLSPAAVRRLRGKYQHLPLMETLQQIKREEKARSE